MNLPPLDAPRSSCCTYLSRGLIALNPAILCKTFNFSVYIYILGVSSTVVAKL